MTARFPSFTAALYSLKTQITSAPQVKTERWQGVQANQDTREVFDVNFSVDLFGVEDLDHWRRDIRPNLPWADDTFAERTGGEPLNPGESWRWWPWGQSANKFRNKSERFNHSYPERLWGKYARRTADGKLPGEAPDGFLRKFPPVDLRPKFGVAWHYGDLQDLVDLLVEQPHTRQAVIPLFWPEDTGRGDGGRKMCSLLYNVLVRDNRASMWYPLRSCDMRRHFQDDAYLAVRMLLWIIDRCRERSEFWKQVEPGHLAMHMTSLHIFESDYQDLVEAKW